PERAARPAPLGSLRGGGGDRRRRRGRADPGTRASEVEEARGARSPGAAEGHARGGGGRAAAARALVLRRPQVRSSRKLVPGSARTPLGAGVAEVARPAKIPASAINRCSTLSSLFTGRKPRIDSPEPITKPQIATPV